MNSFAFKVTKLVYDERIRSIVFQAIILGSIFGGFWWLVSNTINNLASQNKSFGFGFLDQTAGFQISSTLGTWVMEYNVGTSTYVDVFLIGIINTLLVAFIGIIAATILGFIIGIMRLSNNVVFKLFSAFYVEVVRNVPLLLQLFFWYFAVLRALPSRREQIEILEGIAGINITGLYLPAPVAEDGAGVVVIALLLFSILALAIGRWAKKRQYETGKTFPIPFSLA